MTYTIQHVRTKKSVQIKWFRLGHPSGKVLSSFIGSWFKSSPGFIGHLVTMENDNTLVENFIFDTKENADDFQSATYTNEFWKARTEYDSANDISEVWQIIGYSS